MIQSGIKAIFASIALLMLLTRLTTGQEKHEGEIAIESYYTDPKELVCLNCPVGKDKFGLYADGFKTAIRSCDEDSENCSYQKNINSKRMIQKRYYQKLKRDPERLERMKERHHINWLKRKNDERV